MKLHRQESYNGLSQINFEGQRVNKRIVSQLTKNNRYSLTEPNQRYIADAITQLGQTPGKKTVDFLLTAAKNLKYYFSNTFNLKHAPLNNWKEMLLTAAASAAVLTQGLSSDKYKKKIHDIDESFKINPEEKNIMALKDSIIQKVDFKQINSELNGSMQKFEENLDYFIVSSETTLKDKKTILEKLNFFLSDDYKINPQLEDKKSIAVAEIVNDLAIDVPGNDIPNIKAVNQKQHGMCAAIAIVRKKLAYESKVDYINLIMSELDNTDKIEVYDRTKLGTGKKTYVGKIPLDFQTAIDKGYRIIDTSALYWMQIANMTGASNIPYSVYHPFDKNNFDVNTDKFYNATFPNDVLQSQHAYYQALVKAKDVIEKYKAQNIKRQLKINESQSDFNKNLPVMTKIIAQLHDKIRELAPSREKSEITGIIKHLVGLEHNFSKSIKKDDKYGYIPNEEEAVKKNKTELFLKEFLNLETIDSKDLDEIYNLVDVYNSISNDKVNKLSRKARANGLYRVGAAYRYQFVKSLDNDDILYGYINELNLPNREILIEDTIKKYIKILNTNDKNSKNIINDISKKLVGINPNKDEVKKFLEDIAEPITNTMDSLYPQIFNSLGLKDCNDGMIFYIDFIKHEIENGRSENYEAFYDLLNVNNEDELYDSLTFLQQELPRLGQRGYAEVYKKLGGFSQTNLIYFVLSTIEHNVETDNRELIDIIKECNGLPENTDKESILYIIQTLKDSLISVESMLANAELILQIHNEEGDIVDSASAKDLIIKKYENKGYIPKEKDLRNLQQHLSVIEKESYSDEFSKDKGKKSHTYEFSKNEKIFMNDIEKNINPMLSDVKRQLERLKKFELKGSLEELNRIIGVNNGKYWTSEGDSGLTTENEIRILEYATGRPYHSTMNINDMIKKVKTSPFSAITSSSVYHDSIGMHAQYVADIAPVKVKVQGEDGTTTSHYKDVLYHDNTWGPAEHDNVWRDSSGLQRTDYKDKRGGTLGYITDAKYRNGNLVDRIKGEMLLEEQTEVVNSKLYKKMKGLDRAPIKTTQYQESIIEGISATSASDAETLEREIFNDDERIPLNALKAFAEKHTKKEIMSEINKIKTSAQNWYSHYEQLKNKILSKEFDNVKTPEDYQKIDSKIRLIMEKTALAKTPNIKNYYQTIAEAKSFGKLQEIKELQKKEAQESFMYAFSKNNDQITSGLTRAYAKFEPEMVKILKEAQIKIKASEIDKIQKKLNEAALTSDGSLKNTINGILLAFEGNEILAEKQCSEEVMKELKEKFSSELTKLLYFDKTDINNPKLQPILNFIDKNFDPADDKELIKIYRKFQDYTLDQFNEEVTPLITDEDINLNKTTGFDIFKKIRSYDDITTRNLMNMVYNQAIVAECGNKDSCQYYKNYKLNRTTSYQEKYNFRNSYEELYENLSILSLPKLMQKMKIKYFPNEEVYPAYPQVDYMNKEDFDDFFTDFMREYKTRIVNIQSYYTQIESYKIGHSLMNYLEKLSPNDTLTKSQHKNIISQVDKLFALDCDNDNVKEIINSAEEILNLSPEEKWEKYMPAIYSITTNIMYFEDINSKADIMRLIKKEKQELDSIKNHIVETDIQKKYHNTYHKLLNDYRLSIVKGNLQNENDLLNKLYKEFYRANIFAKPEEVLNKYLLSLATDSDSKGNTEKYNKYLKVLIRYSKLGVIQELIMNALSQGNEMEIKNALINKNSKEHYEEEIALLVDSLVIEDDIETALIIIEKLGLGEEYIKHLDTFMEKDMKSLSRKLKTISALVDNYSNFKQDYINVINSFDSNTISEKETMEDLKQQIFETVQRYKLPAYVLKIFTQTFEEFEKKYINKNGIDKNLYLAAMLDEALNSSDSRVNDDIKVADNSLYRIETYINVINNMFIKDRTKPSIIRKKLNNEFQKLVAIYDSLNLQA